MKEIRIILNYEFKEYAPLLNRRGVFYIRTFVVTIVLRVRNKIKMIKHFEVVNIRRIQFVREIKLLGFLYSAAIFILLGIVVYKLSEVYQEFLPALYAVFTISSLLISVQVMRRDKVFLSNQFEDSYFKIIPEYSLYVLPFVIPLLFSKYFYLIAVVILSVILIPLLKIELKERTGARFLGKIVSPKDFEWLSGLRKRRFYFGFLLAAAYAFSFVLIVPLFLIWFLTTLIFEFYRDCEPLNMLRVNGYSAGKFLFVKILRHSFLYAVLFVPALVLNSLFNPETVFINSMFLIVQFTVLVLAILMKYRIYTPLDSLQGLYIYLIVIQVVTVLPLFIGGIPLLSVLPLILCVRFYYSAKNNLKEYL